MSYFNDEQMDHMRSLSKLAAEGKVCPCGWYTKDECAKRCQSTCGSAEAQSAHNAELKAKAEGRS